LHLWGESGSDAAQVARPLAHEGHDPRSLVERSVLLAAGYTELNRQSALLLVIFCRQSGIEIDLSVESAECIDRHAR